MHKPRDIKRAQRQSYILNEISPVLRELFSNEDSLSQLFVTRVELSSDGSICRIFLSTFSSKTVYEQASKTLMLYKPSVRKALSQILHSRYTPDVRFHYDAGKEKERHLDGLFEKIVEPK
jgi:ribosome-binding factor A